MHLRLQRLREALRTSLWAVPSLCTAVAVLLAVVLLQVDERVAGLDGGVFGFGGGPSAARDLLGTIATAVLSVAGVVFSITMLVLQQASRQLSPRVMRTYLRDWPSQLTLGAFIATFAYALIVLSQVRSDDGATFTPGLATWGAMVLTAVSVAMFVVFVHHVATSLQPVTVIGRVGLEIAVALDHPYPGSVGDDPEDDVAPPDRPPDRSLRWAGPSGSVTGVDGPTLAAWAVEHDAVVALRREIGEHLVTGAEVLDVWWDHGPPDPDDGAELDPRTVIGLGRERTMADDAAFGFRQIVDIAVRALSPGVNDPTTAVQALDELHARLRQLAEMELPSPCRCVDGRLRLILPRPGWAQLVALALDEIRQDSVRSAHVVHRLGEVIADLSHVVDRDRHRVLVDERRLLRAAIERAFPDRHDREFTLRPLERFTASPGG